MSRKYTKIKELEPQILAMRAEGKTFPSCNFMIAVSIIRALGKCKKCSVYSSNMKAVFHSWAL